MAISDVLSEAVDGIDDYLADAFYQDLYKGDMAEIQTVRESIEKLRAKLDAKGSCEWVPQSKVKETLTAEKRVRGGGTDSGTVSRRFEQVKQLCGGIRFAGWGKKGTT
jgi:hypothetical protein